MSTELMKENVATAALELIEYDTVLGVGTGSTVNYFIDALATIKNKIKACVPSSNLTAQRLKAHGFVLEDLNSVGEVNLYVDGADEFNDYFSLIKGGGGALTREKIIAAASKKFVVIANEHKHVNVLGKFPLPIEVVPMARSYVARQIVKLGGDPQYRENFVTDNGNVILDIFNLKIVEPIKLEEQLNNIVGVVTNGLFARRGADQVIVGTTTGTKFINKKR